MRFTQHLWSSISGIYEKTLEHPFIVGLIDATLDEEAFRFYVIQDALYLRDFGRGLAILGTKAPEDRWLRMFLEHARDALVVERALHESFFKEWNLTDENIRATPPTPITLLYTSYLLRVAYERPFHETVGAFLPCYWIYWEVGKVLEKSGSSKDLYGKWIETYSSEQYASIVEEVLEVMDRAAEDLTQDAKERIRGHFITSSKLEYLFWDMGFHRKGWKI
jgi:thiaminase/transcriptional activator TenA